MWVAIVAIEYKYEILKKKLEYNQILKKKLNVKQIILTYTYTNTHALCLSICMIKIMRIRCSSTEHWTRGQRDSQESSVLESIMYRGLQGQRIGQYRLGDFSTSSLPRLLTEFCSSLSSFNTPYGHPYNVALDSSIIPNTSHFISKVIILIFTLQCLNGRFLTVSPTI